MNFISFLYAMCEGGWMEAIRCCVTLAVRCDAGAEEKISASRDDGMFRESFSFLAGSAERERNGIHRKTLSFNDD
jgi:hypothetical protein